jgi:hypothetical protein
LLTGRVYRRQLRGFARPLLVVAEERTAKLGQPFGRILEDGEEQVAFGGRECERGRVEVERLRESAGEIRGARLVVRDQADGEPADVFGADWQSEKLERSCHRGTTAHNPARLRAKAIRVEAYNEIRRLFPPSRAS